ncbi:MAG: glycosyltransferase [Deltaproteobacteria bacterium]|nr:glycosyltransferase [Deltaproteobacteria bacterium]
MSQSAAVPTIRVIIPTFNRAAMLVRAIDSVLAQTCQDFELLVVDDGSTDNTVEVINGYGRRLTFIRQVNSGAAAARNTGIRAARADLLAFLDSDDWFIKDKLEIQLAVMRENPAYLVSHTQEKWLRRGKHLNQKKRHRKESGDLFDRCLRLCVVGMSTIMARRQLFAQVGFFDESLPCCEDYELWLRVAARYPFLLVDRPLTVKEGGRPDQLSVLYRQGMDKYRIRALCSLLESGILSAAQAVQARQELARKCRIYGNGCFKHGREEEGRRCQEIRDQVTEGIG